MNFSKTIFLTVLYTFFSTAYVHSMNTIDYDIDESLRLIEFEQLKKTLIKNPELFKEKRFSESSLLFLAVKFEDIDAIKFFIEKCPSLLLLPNKGHHLPLHRAAWTGRADLSCALISSPHVGQDFYKNSRTMLFTLLSIHKILKNKKTIGLLPKVVLLRCIVKPLIKDEEYIDLHKERIKTMLSWSSSTQRPFELVDEEDEPVRELLDPEKVTQFDEEIEKLYRIIP